MRLTMLARLAWLVLIVAAAFALDAWLHSRTDDPWAGQIQIRCEDAQGMPIENATFVLMVDDDLGPGKGGTGGAQPQVRFANGHYLLGLPPPYANIGTADAPDSRKATLHVDAPHHGKAAVQITKPSTTVIFPDPAWVTLSFDPPLDPRDLDRREIWIHDDEHGATYGKVRLDELTFDDGLRLGPFVPGGYSFALKRESANTPRTSAMGHVWDDIADVVLQSGENAHTIRR